MEYVAVDANGSEYFLNTSQKGGTANMWPMLSETLKDYVEPSTFERSPIKL